MWSYKKTKMYFKMKKFSDEEVENFVYDEIWRVLVVKTAKIFVVEALNVHAIFLDKIAGNLVFSINEKFVKISYYFFIMRGGLPLNPKYYLMAKNWIYSLECLRSCPQKIAVVPRSGSSKQKWKKWFWMEPLLLFHRTS